MKSLGLTLLLILTGSLVATAAPVESDLFAEAESRYLGKNYVAALEGYDSFLAAFPLSERTADVQYRRAVCMYRLGRFRDCVQLVSEIEKRYRSTRYFAWVPLWKGLAHYQLGSWSLSVESLDAFLAGPPDSDLTPQARLYKALALQALADLPAASASLRALLDGFPSSSLVPYASVLLGSLLQKLDADAELLAFTQSTDASSFPEPRRSEFLLLRAEALWKAGRRDEAQPLYIRLVGASDDAALVAYGRLFASAQSRQDLAGMKDLTQAAEARFAGSTAVLAELWTRVGAESFRQGALDSAEPFLRRAWNVRGTVPVNEVVPLYLAEITLQKKDPVAAKQILLDHLAAGNPGTGALIIRLGDYALAGEDFAGAAGWYARFRSAFPDSRRSSEAGYLLAYCLYRQQKPSDALALVEDLLGRAPEAAPRQQLSRLRINLLTEAKRTQEAADALREYSTRYPNDLRSRVDYIKALFVLKRNTSIVTEADAVRAQFPDMGTRDPAAFVVVSYLRGLALIASKEYAAAVPDLGAIQPSIAAKAGLGVIVPYARYYLGWAYLRTSDFPHAAQVFDELAAAYPAHELSPMTWYLAGWSHFSAGEFDRAASAFSRLASRTGGDELSQKSAYLYAKSLLNSKKRVEALQALLGIVNASPASPWAPDALFDYAGALSDAGQARQAADAYRRLADTFPDSPLREESFYRRGETLFTHSLFPEARAAFDDYRTRYPKGRLLDAALYWSGMAASKTGEGMAAALLWEQLTAGYADSTFRGSALQQTAEAYAQARQFPRALDLYTRYISEYPSEARAARADIRAEQIRLLASGEGDREAELSAIISRETGAKKRQATIDLAKLYIYSGDARADSGYRLLLPVVKEGDAQAAPQAQLLVAEYFYRKADLLEAARQFVAAAALRGADPSVAASALYRAAEMMQLANRPDDVAALVKRLRDTFPGSEWTEKAARLSGGAP
jgi:TolA-binding protein